MLAIHLFAFFHDKDSDLPNIPAEKENAIETQHFHSVLSTYSILVFVLFDFRYFLCRSSNDTQALVAHAVKQRIKLSPLRGFLGVITWKEKLVYRNVIPGNEVIENLQTRLLSFVLDIRKVTRGDKKLVAYLFAAFSVFISRGFNGSPESLKIIYWYWSFCHIHSPYYILQFTFPFGYVYIVPIISLNKASYSHSIYCYYTDVRI